MKFVLLKHPPDPNAPATACAKDFWKLDGWVDYSLCTSLYT